MKRKPVIKKQAVERRRKKRTSTFRRLLSFMFGCFTKFSLLVICLTVISAMLVTAYGYLLRSPYIRLEKVIIQGFERDSKRDLLRLSGLNGQMSLLAIDTEQVRQRIKGHPWVREVVLEKQFPHALVIKVEKEEACAMVLLDRLYYVNRWGEIFKPVEEGEDTDFPVITGVGKAEETRNSILKEAVRLINFLESEGDQWSVEELAEVHMERDGSVSLYFNSLPAPVTANSSDIGFRMAGLKKVVEDLNKKGTLPMVKKIDLSYPDGAVVSFKNG
ncbi:MAG: FtsQ-type POTRA domain-containing protein [Deltaproteobacteria bacterium]|nr:FtsQ-type POTRA domain-containing protein [Deltaproteobacteria bacterium]